MSPLFPGEWSRRKRSCSRAATSPLSGFQRDLFIGAGVGEARDQAEAGLADPRSMTVDEGELPDRRVHRALVDDLLHLLEDRAALLLVELGALLLEHLVEIGGSCHRRRPRP